MTTVFKHITTVLKHYMIHIYRVSVRQNTQYRSYKLKYIVGLWSEKHYNSILTDIEHIIQSKYHIIPITQAYVKHYILFRTQKVR